MLNPTPEQIQKVQSNLANMQKFNDYIHSYGQDKILNAYLLLSQRDASDSGPKVIISLMEAAFSGIGSAIGPIGSAASSLINSFINSWTSNPPSSLNGTFASYIDRFSNTHRQIDNQLAIYIQNTEEKWNEQFPYQGENITLADLASGDFPIEKDVLFGPAAEASLFALDRHIWMTMLQSNFIMLIYKPYNKVPAAETDIDTVTNWLDAHYEKEPASYVPYVWQKKVSDFDYDGWVVPTAYLKTGSSEFAPALSKDAANYLFVDKYAAQIINRRGLFKRAAVFKRIGLRQEFARTPGLGGVDLPYDPFSAKASG